MTEIIPSSTAGRLKRCRRELTLQLVLRSGPFWETVQGFRARWSIEPIAKLPSESDEIPFPPTCPQPTSSSNPPEPNQSFDWKRAATCWQDDVLVTLFPVVPPECRIPEGLWRSDRIWFAFLAACARFDPPETDELLAFADRHEPTPESLAEALFIDSTAGRPSAKGEKTMVAPAITYLDPDQLDALHRWREAVLIGELHRHLEPLGVDLKALVRQVRNDPAYIERLISRRFPPDPSKVHIVVTPETTEQDVCGAWRLIQPWFQAPTRRGRPKIDPLEAVQAAILSQQGWTQAEIAKHFGWESHPTSSDPRKRPNPTRSRIKLGHKLLKSRDYSAE
jgi:hypothetical protein